MIRAMTDREKTGENSVDFSLQDQNGKTFRLSEHIGLKHIGKRMDYRL
jgi:hypothetical protein